MRIQNNAPAAIAQRPVDSKPPPPPPKTPAPPPPPQDTFTAAPAKPKTYLDVPQLDQGDSNACGTTSLAAIANYFGVPVTREQIDRDIRSFDQGTAPDNLVSWARAHGFRAEMKNEASIDDITRLIDQGIPPMVLIDKGSKGDLQTHYVVVNGYDRGPDGRVSLLHVTDPNGFRASYTPEELTRRWDDINLAGISTGERRLLLSFAPAGSRVELPTSSLGAGLRNASIRNLEDGAADLLNGIRRGRIGDAVGGAFEAAAGLPGFLIGKIPLPGFRELGGAIGTVVNAVAEPIKKLGNVISNGLRAVGRFFRHLF